MDNFKNLNTEGYDEATVLRMFREGKLYCYSTDELSEEERITRIREYVARIDSLVTREFRNTIHDLWDAIFHSEELMSLLSKRGKIRKFTDFNKYNLMRIICVMRSNGVYQEKSDPTFHRLLENTNRDSSLRAYLGLGLESRETISCLRKIIAEHRDS